MNFLSLASFAEVMNYVLYILIAILILLVMITVHEFGHFITGKIFGFGINEFAIGFGPKLYSRKKKNGELFSIRLLPLGGFCAFSGEDADSDDPKAFNNKKPWQRIIVLVSGAFMNYLLAVFLICIMFGTYGSTSLMTFKVDNSAVLSAQTFQDKDVILKANGKNIYLVTDLMNVLDGKKQNEVVEFRILRNGKEQDLAFALDKDVHIKNVEDMGALCSVLGVEYNTDETGKMLGNGFRSTGVRLSFFGTIGRSFEYSFKVAGTIFTVFRQLITGNLGIKSLGGTVTTISVTANAVKTGGLWSLLNIAGFIGVNLAVFNLLPFPALDGSRVVFTIFEWIRRKPLNRKVEGIIHTIGFVLILLFAVFVDLQQCL